ncbi:uncharacterized protein LOC135216204 [Macrobrachium nipponense]|uniref:uncharacterized protein LOC135216204 n=1 Tax=Macrobrachium nipponense TaxID=159736 RepID=UPI0030C8512C
MDSPSRRLPDVVEPLGADHTDLFCHELEQETGQLLLLHFGSENNNGRRTPSRLDRDKTATRVSPTQDFGGNILVVLVMQKLSYLFARLEEELIGDDLDYEYDLDEEEEEALLAGEVSSHGVAVEDIIEFKVDDEFGGEEDGGQITHTKSVHSRLHGGPNRLQASGRLQAPNTLYEDDDLQNRRQTGRLQPPTSVYDEEEMHQNRLQSSGRLQPPNTVYEEVQQNRLQSSGRLQPANTVYEEEEIQETYDSSISKLY